MRPLRTLLVAAVTLVTLGCAPPPHDPASPDALPAVSPLRLGAADHAALSDGQDVELVAGAQGGFHVWMTWAVGGMRPQALTLERTAHRLGDGKPVLRTSATVEIGAPGADGSFAPVDPIPMFMCPSPIGLSVIDQPIVFELRLADEHGATLAGGAVTLVPHCPADGEQRDFCVRICSG